MATASPPSLRLFLSLSSLHPETDAAKYEHLIEEEMDAIRIMRKEEEIPLHPHFDYWNPSLNLSKEEAEILTRVRPATVRAAKARFTLLTHPALVIAGVRRFPDPECGSPHRVAADTLRETVAGEDGDLWRWSGSRNCRCWGSVWRGIGQAAVTTVAIKRKKCEMMDQRVE